jgi:hypothetical protein
MANPAPKMAIGICLEAERKPIKQFASNVDGEFTYENLVRQVG